jgi:hypothetical protein
MFGPHDEAAVEAEEPTVVSPRQRFIAAGFDGWSREIGAFDVVVIDDRRLLVVDRDPGSSRLRAEDLRSGDVLWTITLPDIHITDVQASADGRWRAFARRGLQFARIQGIVGDSQFTSTRWTVNTGRRTYVDTPRNDGGSVALAVAPQWDAPALSALLTDWRQTTRLLRVDEAGTTELATSHLRVECPAPPIGVTGYICVSYDGRSSRIWRIDLTSGHLLPVAETRHVILSASQDSQQRLTGAVNGRPMIADLESRTLTTLIPEPYCWAMDVDVAKDVAVSICTDGVFTTATQYRLPASAY